MIRRFAHTGADPAQRAVALRSGRAIFARYESKGHSMRVGL